MSEFELKYDFSRLKKSDQARVEMYGNSNYQQGFKDGKAHLTRMKREQYQQGFDDGKKEGYREYLNQRALEILKEAYCLSAIGVKPWDEILKNQPPQEQ